IGDEVEATELDAEVLERAAVVGGVVTTELALGDGAGERLERRFVRRRRRHDVDVDRRRAEDEDAAPVAGRLLTVGLRRREQARLFDGAGGLELRAARHDEDRALLALDDGA